METIRIDSSQNIKQTYKLEDSESLSKQVNFEVSNTNIQSTITVKAVVFGSGKFDFDGKLVVKKGAKNANLYLKIAVLLIGERAKARVIPGLEINENEVKAGHAATVGFLDQKQLQYLESRGIPNHTAKKILIEAFLK